jgi:hypothetical protein
MACTSCENNSFVSNTGSTQCSTCRLDCEFDEFTYQECKADTDKECKPYQYTIPIEGKIAVACLPPVVWIFSAIVSSTLSGSNVSCFSVKAVWPTFLGAYDMSSDWVLLVLIEPSNPWKIFWVALISLLLSSSVSITLGWRFAHAQDHRPAYTAWLCLTSSAGRLKEEERYLAGCRSSEYRTAVNRLHWSNYRLVLLLETAPLLVVQVILLKTTNLETQAVDWVIISEVIIMCMHIT